MTKRDLSSTRALGGAALVLLAVACAGPEPRPAPESGGPTPGVAADDPAAWERPTRAPREAATNVDDPTAEDDTADSAPKATRSPSNAVLRTEASRVLDDWHDAASVGDRDRYIAHFSPDAVFLGTDASERWDLATFTAYVDDHFGPGGGWTYRASNRHVVIGPNKQVAWFDEALENDSYGELRGSGALRRDGDTWRIAHYNMTFTIPNGIAKRVVDIVRYGGE